MSQSKHYDAVVIGAGHNGLTSACYLAAQGKKVVVVEALEKVGGMCSSGYSMPEAPEHMIHPCALDLMSLRVSIFLTLFRYQCLGALKIRVPERWKIVNLPLIKFGASEEKLVGTMEIGYGEFVDS